MILSGAFWMIHQQFFQKSHFYQNPSSESSQCCKETLELLLGVLTTEGVNLIESDEVAKVIPSAQFIELRAKIDINKL